MCIDVKGGEDKMGDEGDQRERGNVVSIGTVGRERAVILSLIVDCDAMSFGHGYLRECGPQAVLVSQLLQQVGLKFIGRLAVSV